MNLDHAQLRALAAVVREGSFERAAATLHVTPSAVSQRIRALEDRVGRLLVRRTVPAAATPDGQVLVQLAEQTALLEHDALVRLGGAGNAPPSMPVAVNHDSLDAWFVNAAAAFAARMGTTLDLRSDDQDHTAAMLREGTVLGAVTTQAEPVQGCRVHSLGSIRYAATCSPAFHASHFSRGVTTQALAQAPVLVFNRKDAMPIRFVERVARGRGGATPAGEGSGGSGATVRAGRLRGAGTTPWNPPVWWLPSTHAVVQASVAGLGWTMNPVPYIQNFLDDGSLVLLRARAYEDVPLYWQHWALRSDVMDTLTHCVLEAARVLVKRGRAAG